MKTTNYEKLNNTLVVISFNQPTGEHRELIQPVRIEARSEAWTPEGAVLNVRNEVNLGEPQATKLTNEEIYKYTYSISPVLAKALGGILLSGIDVDATKIDVNEVTPIKATDLAVKETVLVK